MEQSNESCPEVDGVTYMPEVYKMAMVRMFKGELTNPRMYGSRRLKRRNAFDVISVVDVDE